MNKKEIINKELKPKCMHCNRTMPSFGNARKNGKQFKMDFVNRKYHFKCWKLLF